ncbi:MAG: isoprenylcysteine carboxylmethyltransferase family protein [Acidipila sp.]|nr:isoprenylcysteine carboxylmethyltransferase family protein [Acidipila sp.]
MSAPPGWITRWRVRAGYPAALVFLVFARPAPIPLEAGAMVAALGLFVRGYAAGYLYKHETLATAGPYAWTRNPLYLGSVILAAGIALAGGSWLAAIPLAVYFLVFYPGVMRREEAELRAHYGAAFEEYARRVPLFWPRLPPHTPIAPPLGTMGPAGFSWMQYRRNREYQAAAGAVLGFAALLALMFVIRR